MAVFLDTHYGGRFWDNYFLDVCDEADSNRVKAGKDCIEAEKWTYVRTTRDAWLKEFRKAERPWRADFTPQKLQLTKGKELPDYVHSYPGGNNDFSHYALVSPRLTTLIEAHQTPNDGWQFFPIAILNKDGTAYKDTYHAWCLHKTVDAIDPTSEGVKPVAGDADGRHRWTYIGAKSPERLRVFKSIISGLTAWSDFRLFPFAGSLVSDGLFHDMVAQDMSGFQADSIWSEV